MLGGNSRRVASCANVQLGGCVADCGRDEDVEKIREEAEALSCLGEKVNAQLAQDW